MTVWPNGSTQIPRVSSEFGYRWHPVSGVWRLHSGIDLWGWSSVVSPVDGVVETAAYSGGFGNLVVIREDGTGDTFWLAHNRSMAVRRGQRVREGQHVAVMGTTGSSTGVHCHLETHPRSGAAVNPRSYMAKAVKPITKPTAKPTPVVVSDEEDDMRFRIGHRNSGDDEWMLVHPELVGKSSKERGYIVTSDPKEALAWTRLFGNGWTKKLVGAGGRYDFDLDRADYIAAQEAARRVYSALRKP